MFLLDTKNNQWNPIALHGPAPLADPVRKRLWEQQVGDTQAWIAGVTVPDWETKGRNKRPSLLRDQTVTESLHLKWGEGEGAKEE